MGNQFSFQSNASLSSNDHVMLGRIEKLENQLYVLTDILIGMNPHSIQFIDNQTPELRMLALNGDPTVIQYIKNPTYEECMKAVSENGFLLEFCPVDNFTDDQLKELYTVAVMHGGARVLAKVKEEYITPKLCLDAVCSDPTYAQFYVPSTMEYIQAWRCIIYNEPRNICMLYDSKELYDALKSYAFQLNWMTLEEMPDPTEEMMLTYIKNYPAATWYKRGRIHINTKHPTDKVRIAMIMKTIKCLFI